MEQHSVVLDAITYSALISTYEKAKQPEQALKLFQAMVQRDVVPNAITYSALISSCAKGKQ